MIKELSEAVLKKYSEEEIDKMIIDNHTLTIDDPYVLLDFDDKGELYVEDVVLIKEKDSDVATIKNYRELCSYEYYSRTYNANKVVSNKQTFTINYLSLRINMVDYNEDKLFKHFEKLKDFKQWESKTTKNAMYELENQLPPIDGNIVEKFKKWLLENLSKYALMTTLKNKKKYVNVYIRYNLETYKAENLRYNIYKTFNKNEDSKVIKDVIFGVTDNSIQLDSKKPQSTSKGFLTKKENNIPHLMEIKESILLSKVYNMINTLNCKYIYVYKDSIDFVPYKEKDGYNIRSYGKCYEIKGDMVTRCTLVSYNKKMLFNYKNYTDIEYDKLYKANKEIRYGISDNSKQLKALLELGFYIKEKDIKDWVYKNELTQQNAINLANIIDELIVKYLNLDSKLRAANLLNLKLSIKDYVKRGIEMDIMEVKNNLKNKLSGECATIESTEELSVATGQLIAYLISLTESANKSYETKTMLFSLKKNKSATRYIRSLLAKYEYKIKPNKRFNNMYMSVIQGLLNDIQLNEDIVLIGYLSENLLYEKKENN